MNLLCDVGNSDLVLCDNLESGNEVKGRFKREEIYVYLWLIHVDVFVFFFLGVPLKVLVGLCSFLVTLGGKTF